MNEINITAEPGTQVIIIKHVFHAPRELVWKALTDSKIIPQWWGPEILKTTVDQLEIKPGGIWRFIQSEPDGTNYGFHGVYHDIIPFQRIVQTFEYEGMPGHVSLQILNLQEQDNITEATQTSIFQSVEDRDEMLNSGMEEGVIESHKRFTELLKKL